MNEDKFDFESTAKSINAKQLGITERTIPCHHGTIKLFFINQLTDRTALMETVVRPLIIHCSSVKHKVDAQTALDEIIYIDDCKLETDLSQIQDIILSGMVVILFSSGSSYLVANFKKVEHRSVASPELAYTIRGPRDSFTEHMDTNISLVRYRVKDNNLKIKYYTVGERTKTRVAVLYIDDIVNQTVLNEIDQKMNAIHVDGIGESGELQHHLLNSKYQLFPQMGLIERSDMAYNSLMEGKVIMLVDGSGIALLAPKTFPEFMYSCDDRYDNFYFGIFARVLRYLALALIFTGSSLYVAITAFHAEVLPSSYAIFLAQMRSNVPFSAFIGTFALEIITELLREALLRVPKQIGPAIGIVGAIIIGQAAVSAGIFSPLLLIIVSASLLASFAIPDYTIVNVFRILKFALLIFTGMLGFFGFSLFATVILAELVSMKSFGVPYMAPWTPFHFYDFIRSFFASTTLTPKRPGYLRTNDDTRASSNSNSKSDTNKNATK